jgi:hypothetical protein
MITAVANILKNAASFLQEGVAPPNTPPELQKIMEDTNHFASKKFFIIFSAILMVITMFFVSVGFLFILPHDRDIILTAYATIFTKIIEIFGLIISVYIGAQGLVDLRYNSSSNAGMQGMVQSQSRNETRNINLDESILTNNAKEEDYNINEIGI